LLDPFPRLFLRIGYLKENKTGRPGKCWSGAALSQAEDQSLPTVQAKGRDAPATSGGGRQQVEKCTEWQELQQGRTKQGGPKGSVMQCME